MPSPMPRPSSGMRLAPKITMMMTRMRMISIGPSDPNMRKTSRPYADRTGRWPPESYSQALCTSYHTQGFIQPPPPISLRVDHDVEVPGLPHRRQRGRAHGGVLEARQLGRGDLEPRGGAEVAH